MITWADCCRGEPSPDGDPRGFHTLDCPVYQQTAASLDRTLHRGAHRKDPIMDAHLIPLERGMSEDIAPDDRCFTNAREAIDYLTAHPGHRTLYAPGGCGCPAMWIGLANFTPHPLLRDRGRDDTVLLLFTNDGAILSITEHRLPPWLLDPSDATGPVIARGWNAQVWVEQFGGMSASLWAWIRPLLAALGWATGDIEWRREDIHEVERLLNRLRLARRR